MDDPPSILAATDFSAPARHAVARGFALAAATGARYTIMHALGLDALEGLRDLLGDRYPAVSQQIVEQARSALEALAVQVGQAYGLTAQTHLARESAAPAIVQQADRIDAALVVLGAKGEHFAQRLLLGSTVARVLSGTRRPALVVKGLARTAYVRVLVPVDFSAASRDAVVLARWLAPEAELVLLHVFQVPFEAQLARAGIDDESLREYRTLSRQRALDGLRALANSVAPRPGSLQCIARYGTTAHHILVEEQEQDCDLIVMGWAANGAVTGLPGDVTQRVLSDAQADVLVVPASAAAGRAERR